MDDFELAIARVLMNQNGEPDSGDLPEYWAHEAWEILNVAEMEAIRVALRRLAREPVLGERRLLEIHGLPESVIDWVLADLPDLPDS